MSTDLLVRLIGELDARQHLLGRLDSYYEGRSPASFMSASDKIALAKFDSISANVCRAAVLATQERLRVSGFTGPDGVFDLWTANNLDQLHSAVGHRDALLYGGCGAFVICWASPDGRPVASLESAKRVQVVRDPVTREITGAVKRVRDTVAGTTKVWVYLPDRIEAWASNSVGADASAFRLVDVLEHHLERVPVVPIGLEDDPSVIADVLSLQDALNKYLLDSLVASEYSGRPRRYATGVSAIRRPKLDANGDPVTDEFGETVMELVPPFGETNRFMITDRPDASIGQLPSADLSGFTEGIRAILAMVEMSTGLPPHYMGQISTAAQPSSADALRASEAALVSRAESRQGSYGPAWETVMATLIGIRDGLAVDDVAPVRVKWAPADTRSQAQEADAIVKLVASNVLPVTYALQKLGYDADEIAEIRAARRAETLDAQGVNLSARPAPAAPVEPVPVTEQ